MNKGGTVEAAGIRFTMVHADHSGGAVTLSRGGHHATSAAGAGCIEFEDGTPVYHSGDTDLFGDMELVRERWSAGDRRRCRSAGTTRWARATPAARSS